MRYVFCLAVIFLLTSLPAAAGSINVYVRDRPPEIHATPNTQATGPVIELVNLWLRQNNLTARFTHAPWIRSINDAREGKADILLRHSMPPERELFLHPILTGFERRIVNFLYPSNNKIELTNYSDLYAYEIGATRGSFYFEQFDNDPRINRLNINSNEALLNLLEKNRIPLVITHDVRIFNDIAKRKGLPPEQIFKVASFHFSTLNGRYFSLAKKSPYAPFYNTLNCSMIKLRKSGEVDQIFRQHGVTPYIQDFDHPESLRQEESCR